MINSELSDLAKEFRKYYLLRKWAISILCNKDIDDFAAVHCVRLGLRKGAWFHINEDTFEIWDYSEQGLFIVDNSADSMDDALRICRERGWSNALEMV